MRRPVIHLDLETRSAVDLKRVGAHRYAADPSTEVICASYRVDGGPVLRWRPGEPMPQVLQDMDGIVTGHNAQFERNVWNHVICVGDDWGHFPCNPIIVEEQDCTMARGCAVGLPASLEALGTALRAPVQKDKDGQRLMLKLCKPRKIHDDGRIEWWDDPAELERLAAYCDRDVEAECAIDARLPALPERERRLWELDQRINDRGVQLDMPAVRNALLAVGEAKRRADRRIWRLTNGAVKTCNQAAKIAAWINAQGVPCESIAEGEHEELLLAADVTSNPAVEEVVRLRAATAKATKFETMLDWACADGRVRGALRYHSTIQGRWTSTGPQYHNMKRVETDEAAADVALMVTILKQGGSPQAMVDKMEILFDSPMETLSISARTMNIAADGQRLIGGDFKNIEGRINAWLAGQEDKLQAFREFDAGTGPDLYKVTAGSILDIPWQEVTKAQRQETGKVSELSFGYQGAVGAYKRQGAKYGVRLPDARIKLFVAGWRAANWAIAENWKVLQDAAIEAVSARGCVVSVCKDRIRYVFDGKFLYCRLPSGRCIHYPFAQVGWKSKTVVIDGDEVTFNRNTVSYQTARGYREDLYGGAQTAHIVSGIARDVLVEGMFEIEAAGYPIVLTVHDEIVSEAPIGFGSTEDYERRLLKPIPWMGDCPIAASTWEGPRYAH